MDGPSRTVLQGPSWLGAVGRRPSLQSEHLPLKAQDKASPRQGRPERPRRLRTRALQRRSRLSPLPAPKALPLRAPNPGPLPYKPPRSLFPERARQSLSRAGRLSTPRRGRHPEGHLPFKPCGAFIPTGAEASLPAWALASEARPAGRRALGTGAPRKASPLARGIRRAALKGSTEVFEVVGRALMHRPPSPLLWGLSDLGAQGALRHSGPF